MTRQDHPNRSRGNLARGMLAAVLALALVAGACTTTNDGSTTTTWGSIGGTTGTTSGADHVVPSALDAENSAPP